MYFMYFRPISNLKQRALPLTLLWFYLGVCFRSKGTIKPILFRTKLWSSYARVTLKQSSTGSICLLFTIIQTPNDQTRFQMLLQLPILFRTKLWSSYARVTLKQSLTGFKIIQTPNVQTRFQTLLHLCVGIRDTEPLIQLEEQNCPSAVNVLTNIFQIMRW